MNKRIQELAKQASDAVAGNAFSMARYNEKFAELIVRECIGIVEESRISPDSGVCPVAITTSNIKQHFGVEE